MTNIRQAIKTLRSVNNPQMLFNQMAQQNPQLFQVMQMAQQYGSPKNAFYEIAKQKGINPDEFMRDLMN